MSTIDLPSFKRFVGAALILSAQMGKWGILVKDDRGRAGSFRGHVRRPRALAYITPERRAHRGARGASRSTGRAPGAGTEAGRKHNSKIQRQRERQAELRERAQRLAQAGRITRWQPIEGYEGCRYECRVEVEEADRDIPRIQRTQEGHPAAAAATAAAAAAAAAEAEASTAEDYCLKKTRKAKRAL